METDEGAEPQAQDSMASWLHLFRISNVLYPHGEVRSRGLVGRVVICIVFLDPGTTADVSMGGEGGVISKSQIKKKLAKKSKLKSKLKKKNIKAASKQKGRIRV
jgi:hypothetical protein